MRNSSFPLLMVVALLVLAGNASAQTYVFLNRGGQDSDADNMTVGDPYRPSDGGDYVYAQVSTSGGRLQVDTTAHYDIRWFERWYRSAVNLDTGNRDFMNFNADTGYTLRFDLRVLDENHNVNRDDNGDGIADRAGFSIINVSNDGQRALELAFWENEVWAYKGGGVAGAGNATNYANGLFNHGEGVAFNTTAATTRYDLNIQNGRYALYINGTERLGGRLKNYTAFEGSYDPYQQANSVFVTDDTTSGSSSFAIDYVAIIPLVNPVPEPITLGMLALGGFAMLGRRRAS